MLNQSINSNQVLADGATAWCTSQLPRRVVVMFSQRKTRTLGPVHPASGGIRLNARLWAAPRDLLMEVLWHEAAHGAVYVIYGPQARPHGPEWRAPVQRVEYDPTTKLALPFLPGPRPGHHRTGSRRPVVRHRYRCPLCQHAYFVPRKSSSLFCNLCQSSENLEPLHYQPLSRIA